ncbi:MAG: cysteine desulfurase family protein [Hydrogeniiclostridium sp.]
MERQIVYADNAATTPLSPIALEAMLPYLGEIYGNPSTPYSLGRRTKKAIETARSDIAQCLGADVHEIFFTSGGSESDNWALKGAARSMARQGKTHIITTRFEHHAVLHTCAALEKEGFSVTYLDVHENGIIRPEEAEAAIRPETGLMSVMFANNEIGTIQPIESLGAICRENGLLFHTDAVQAVGHLPIDLRKLNIDMLSLSAHKFHGPKGVGVLFCRDGLELPNLIEGGAQERGHRAGTENVAGIMGMAAALKESCGSIEENAAYVLSLREQLRKGLLEIPGCRWNGNAEQRLPGNANISFSGVEGESLLLMLDMQGICVSSGSACTSGAVDPSHVLRAIGLTDTEAKGSLRISLDRENTSEEVEKLVQTISETVHKLRSMNPFWKET